MIGDVTRSEGGGGGGGGCGGRVFFFFLFLFSVLYCAESTPRSEAEFASEASTGTGPSLIGCGLSAPIRIGRCARRRRRRGGEEDARLMMRGREFVYCIPLSSYTSVYRTRRWPLGVIFFVLVDVCVCVALFVRGSARPRGWGVRFTNDFIRRINHGRHAFPARLRTPLRLETTSPMAPPPQYLTGHPAEIEDFLDRFDVRTPPPRPSTHELTPSQTFLFDCDGEQHPVAPDTR